MFFRRSNLLIFRGFPICKEFLGVERQNIRNYSIPGIRPRKFKESHYIEKDGIPKGYQIIYKAPMELYLSAAKNISTLTAVAVVGVTGFQIGSGAKDFEVGEIVNSGGLTTTDTDLIYFGVGFVLINLAIQYLVRKYPLRIYKNDKQYIAVFEAFTPFTQYKYPFAKGEVSELPPKGLSPWKDSMFQVKDRTFLLLSEYFKTPSELTNMFKEVKVQ